MGVFRTATRSKGNSSGRKSKKKSKINPFELKFNRKKRSTLKKSVAPTVQVGTPSLSRKKALKSRADSLAIEYDRLGKANKIIDRRKGEKDPRLNEEERSAQRFAAERMRKTNKFQLADEDDALLTHKGSTLTTIQKYDRTLDVDEDEENEGEIGADVVSVAHFGGGSAIEADEKNRENDDRKQTRKEALAELIAKTKKQRYDKQAAREEQVNETERLDEEWKILMQGSNANGLASAFLRKDETKLDDTPSAYDILFREMKMSYCRRTEAQDRLKTEKEVAAEERDKLFQLEKERLARMELNKPPINDEDFPNKRRNAKENGGFAVRYDMEGNFLRPEKVGRVSVKVVRIDGESSEEEDEEILDEMCDDDNLEKLETDHSDAENSHSELIAKEVTEGSGKHEEVTSLPYVFEMPRSYESFISLVKSSSAEEFESVVERLIKCYHPSLREGNKKRLSRLFLYVLRYFDDCSHTASATDKISCCASSLYMLYKFDIEYSTRCMRALIRDLNRSHQKKPHAMFSFRVIAMLRLVAQLYPVTDIFHPVCTPMFFLAVQFLNDTHVTSVKDMARLLFLASILVDYISESKRYVPEMIAFMRGFLLTSVKNEEDERAPVCNFPVSLPHRHMLLINENCSGPNLTLTKIDLSCVFDEDATSFEDSDLNKALVLHCAFGLLSKLLQIYSVFPHSFTAIFAPVMDIIKRMPQDRYPQWLRSDIGIVQASYGGEIKKHSSFKQLQRPKQTKNMLEFLEPRTEDEGGSKITKLSKDSEKGTNAKKRLMHMYKKEMRGAMKELRKDNRFLASEKRQRVAVRDQERKEKVKELMSSLQQQQGDYNKMRAGRL